MTKKLQQNLIALVIFFAMATFGFYNYLWTPLDKKCTEAETKFSQVEKKLASTKRRAQELPKLQAEMQYLKREVSQLEKFLPEDKEIPGLIRIITKKAQGYQLQLASLNPRPIVAMQHYNEVPFQISLRGRYHSLARFFTDIGQTSRLLSVRDVSYTAYKGSVKDPQTITTNFTFVAYTYRQ